MPEMHLRHSGFTCSPCGPFIKNKEKTKRYKETRDNIYQISRYIYQMD